MVDTLKSIAAVVLLVNIIIKVVRSFIFKISLKSSVFKVRKPIFLRSLISGLCRAVIVVYRLSSDLGQITYYYSILHYARAVEYEGPQGPPIAWPKIV